MKKSILVVSDNYPSSLFPTKGLFVYQLLQEWCKIYDVKVIVPRVYFKTFFKTETKLENDNCDVIFTSFFSFSNLKNGFLEKITTNSKISAINQAFKKRDFIPEFIYTHFLWNAIPSIPLAERINCPIFVAMGESSTDRYEIKLRKPKFKTNVIDKISGFVVVAEQLYEYANKKLIVSKDKILLAPNGVNNERFYKKDKNVARELIGIKKNDFIVAFTGAFIERKGFKDLIEVVDEIEDIRLICIGKGIKPNNNSILFAGTVKNEEIVNYLSAADVFVFPTRAEGSSNALLEAAACGLPIISSLIPEVVNQIGEDNAILIPVGDKLQLKKSILELKNNLDLQEFYSKKSLEIAKLNSLQARSKNIISWINSKL